MGRTRGMGASKGCRTCRRRKVKCDERHPLCMKCEKANVACEGYIREHRFVDEVARTAKHVKKVKAGSIPVTNPSSPSDSSSENARLSNSTVLTKYVGDYALLDDSQASRDVARPSYKAHTYGRELSLGAQVAMKVDENVHIPFLLAHLFSGFPSIPWLYEQATNYTSASALPSVRALAATFFGRRHHSKETMQRGSHLYGQALKGLNEDLQRSDDQAYSIAVLRSAVTLEFYELMAFSSWSGWLKHAGGVGRLIELRGPERHQNPDERAYLEGNRVTIALGSLLQRKRCFLERHEWKTVPWALDPDSKLHTLYLHDILCDIPGLTEDGEALKRAGLLPEQRKIRHELLSNNIVLHLQQLYDWRIKWDQLNPDACYETWSQENYSQSPEIEVHSEPLFPTVFHFTSLEQANEINSYNAVLLLLLRLGSQVIGSSFDTSYFSSNAPPTCTNSPLYPPGTAPSATAVATEICRSVEYHLNCDNSAGPFYMVFPLRVAWSNFEDGTREKKWCESVTGLIADRSGWEVGRGLTGGRTFEEDEK